MNLSTLSNKGKTVKRFDFVVKTEGMVYAIETNFYASSGSKLNETARSYKNIALEAKNMRILHLFGLQMVKDGFQLDITLKKHLM